MSRFATGERVRFAHTPRRASVTGTRLGNEGYVADRANLREIVDAGCYVLFDAQDPRDHPVGMWDDELVSLCPRRGR